MTLLTSPDPARHGERSAAHGYDREHGVVHQPAAELGQGPEGEPEEYESEEEAHLSHGMWSFGHKVSRFKRFVMLFLGVLVTCIW